ncbi:MAG: sulfite exporter TauE/SafE family protein [Geminicoccaceae bacterium]
MIDLSGLLGGPWLTPQWFLASLIVFLGAITQSVTGMAFGLVVAPVLALIAPERLPSSVLIMGVVITALGVWRDRAGLALGEVAPAVAGRAVGASLAALTLVALPGSDWIALLIAVAVLIAVALSLGGWRATITVRNLAIAGTASGYMATLTSIGAPPMGLLYQGEEAARARSALNLYFLLGILISAAAVALSGLMRWPDLMFAALLMPALARGYVTSKPLDRLFVGRSLKPFVIGLAIAAAIVILIRGLFRLSA